MKKLLSILAVAVLAIMPQTIAQAHDDKSHMMETKEEAKTMAVTYHADWCGGCKVLAPKMEEVMNSLDDETKAKFSVAKFDFTDDTTKAATRKMAMEGGLSTLYITDEAKPPTGVIKLVDRSNRVLAKIHYKMSVEEIKGVIKGVTSRV